MNLFSHNLALGLARLRQINPRIYCISNMVTAEFVYNTLLALGAKPLVSQAEEEAAELCSNAHSLVINTATPNALTAAAMLAAAREAKARGLPWVLDPRGLGLSTYRDEIVHELLKLSPTVVRTKPPEMMALSRKFGYAPRASEAGRTAEETVEAARFLSQQTGAIAVMTGTTDIVTDHARTLRLTNGHKIMGQVAGMGAGLSAMIAGFISSEDDKMTGAAIAVSVYNIVAEVVAADIEGPLAFRTAFVDKLHVIDANNAMRRLKVL